MLHCRLALHGPTSLRGASGVLCLVASHFFSEFALFDSARLSRVHTARRPRQRATIRPARPIPTRMIDEGSGTGGGSSVVIR
jgi:hypothetical protein